MKNLMPTGRRRRYLMLPLPVMSRTARNISLVAVLVLLSNFLSHFLLNRDWEQTARLPDQSHSGELYLLDKAARYIEDEEAFALKVEEVARQLAIPPEWLMAVMYAESRFDPGVFNQAGSGAIGLIQFMPATAQELNISVERLQRMDAIRQMEYVYLYLDKIRQRYGEYHSLPDLYLGILYPKARKQPVCYTLYAQPAIAFQRNSGLDEDHDGRVTIYDIDQRMKRLFPTAYQVKRD